MMKMGVIEQKHSSHFVDHQSLLAACTEPTLTPSTLLHSPHYNTPVTITALINYHFLASRHPHTLTASDTPLFLFNWVTHAKFCNSWRRSTDRNVLSFNEVTAVFLLNNSHFHFGFTFYLTAVDERRPLIQNEEQPPEDGMFGSLSAREHSTTHL